MWQPTLVHHHHHQHQPSTTVHAVVIGFGSLSQSITKKKWFLIQMIYDRMVDSCVIRLQLNILWKVFQIFVGNVFVNVRRRKIVINIPNLPQLYKYANVVNELFHYYEEELFRNLESVTRESQEMIIILLANYFTSFIMQEHCNLTEI